jgi:hypothetical protein
MSSSLPKRAAPKAPAGSTSAAAKEHNELYRYGDGDNDGWRMIYGRLPFTYVINIVHMHSNQRVYLFGTNDFAGGASGSRTADMLVSCPVSNLIASASSPTVPNKEALGTIIKWQYHSPPESLPSFIRSSSLMTIFNNDMIYVGLHTPNHMNHHSYIYHTIHDRWVTIQAFVNRTPVYRHDFGYQAITQPGLLTNRVGGGGGVGRITNQLVLYVTNERTKEILQYDGDLLASKDNPSLSWVGRSETDTNSKEWRTIELTIEQDMISTIVPFRIPHHLVEVAVTTNAKTSTKSSGSSSSNGTTGSGDGALINGLMMITRPIGLINVETHNMIMIASTPLLPPSATAAAASSASSSSTTTIIRRDEQWHKYLPDGFNTAQRVPGSITIMNDDTSPYGSWLVLMDSLYRIWCAPMAVLIHPLSTPHQLRACWRSFSLPSPHRDHERIGEQIGLSYIITGQDSIATFAYS